MLQINSNTRIEIDGSHVDIKTYYMELGVIQRDFVYYMFLAVAPLEASRGFKERGSHDITF